MHYLLLVLDNECVDRCPLGTYNKAEDHRCLPCHASCHSCSGPSNNDCLSCPPGTRLHDYTCQSCSLQHYYDAETSACQKCHHSCHTCSGPSVSECKSCSGQLHLEGNKICVPCCDDDEKYIDGVDDNVFTEKLQLNKKKCCICDKKRENCLSSLGEKHRVNGNKKRSSTRAKNLATTNYLDAIVVFFTLTLITFLAVVAYKKYKWSRRRIRNNGRSKWRRVNHQYEKVPSHPTESSNIGCDDHELEFHNSTTSTGNGNDTTNLVEFREIDDEDEIDISTFRFGDERRRLLMHNGRNSPPFNNIST